MKQRCLNPRHPDYPSYGGRGITIHPAWLAPRTGYSAFLADVGDRPAGTTLDRKDNDGHYEPDNVRWATPKEQSNNRRQPRKRAA